MALWNNRVLEKSAAQQTNYKLDTFNSISNDAEVADFSAIKKYFNKLYGYDAATSSLDSFTSESEIQTVYASEETNKIKRLYDYRQMAVYPEIAKSLDTLCNSVDVPDENNNIVTIKVNDNTLQASDILNIKEAAQEYLDLFDFDNNLIEYFRRLLIEGQLCWENIIAKDEQEQGIIGINIIPNEAYEFAYDLKLRKKIGIMITNTAVDMYNIVNQGISNIPNAGPINTGGYGATLNCYQELTDNQVIVLPFEQLTYIDSGIFSSDNKIVYPPLERARRAYNQLMLIEDSVLIYRMVRSPERWVMNVDIGRMGAIKGQQKVAELKKQFGTKKMYDPATGTIGKTYDPITMTENFWFVKGEGSEGIKVENLSQNGANFDELKDLEYFLKKLYRALNIPISRFFEANTDVKIGGADALPSAEELDMAKFLMSLQKRFALGLLNGLITHLKFKGLWEQYKLKRSSIDIVFTPPIEYQQFRRSKLLESKLAMVKSFIGEEAAGKLFSKRIALQEFMGWDDARIEENERLKFKESVEAAKLEGFLEKVKAGTIDVKGDGTPFTETLKEILQKSTIDKKDDNASSDDSSSGDDSGGDEFGSDDSGGGDDAGGDDAGGW